MDTIEATKTVLSRIQTIDPENASKIMGYILIQTNQNEIIRLAFGPETHLHSVINQAKSFLNISSNTPSATSPWSFRNGGGGGGSSFYDDDVSRCMCFGKNGGDEMCLGGNGRDGFDEFLRMSVFQQQMQRGGGGGRFFEVDRCMEFGSPSATAAAALMGRMRPTRHELALASMGLGNSSSRQIYLTFPADSTFKEEDVSNYFSIFGPVQDVRIPYQQKRMFGFVTFILPETVKAILAKGNPHFVCESRVLVKPYIEKGKIPEKKHHQHHQIQRGDFSALESAEPFDHIPFGARMFNHDMMLKNKVVSRVELQQSIDLQERNLKNMRLTTTDESLLRFNSLNIVSEEEMNGSGTQEPDRQVNDADSDHQSFFEHMLPDNLFAAAAPTKIADDAGANNINLNLESCYFQMPRKLKE